MIRKISSLLIILFSVCCAEEIKINDKQYTFDLDKDVDINEEGTKITLKDSQGTQSKLEITYEEVFKIDGQKITDETTKKKINKSIFDEENS